jgi:hypothetical protein
MTAPVVFLLDVDNTLLDNDRIIADLHEHVAHEFGAGSASQYWTAFEALRSELGYADYLGALQRYRTAVQKDPGGIVGRGRQPNMVLPGDDATERASVDAVADATVQCFLRAVPAAVPGIVFLSGGQDARRASVHLNAMHKRFRGRLPWALGFSFARAIQQPALELWRGEATQARAAQQALLHRADCNRAARRGAYDAAADAPRAP